MSFEGPVLSLQPTSASSSLPTFHVHSDLLETPTSPLTQTTRSENMSSSGSHLVINSKPRAASLVECMSVPNSPQANKLTPLSSKVRIDNLLNYSTRNFHFGAIQKQQ